MKINPEEVTVRTCQDEGFVVEDNAYHQLFVLYPMVGPGELISQVVAIANHYHEIGRNDGRAEIREEFKRLMGVPRV